MKKSLPVFLLLLIIVGALIASRVWVYHSSQGDGAALSFEQGGNNGQNPGSGPGTGTGQNPDTDEEDRLLAQQIAAEEREAMLADRRIEVLDVSRLLFRGYFYEEAIDLLNADEDIINFETQELEAEILEAVEDLELFNGEIKHIFFHSLILYPEVLFPNLSVPTGGYNEGFIYQSELFRLLPQLLERGYVLYDIKDIFSKDTSGVMRQNDIYLPAGKRPLVISIDDPSYHYGQRFVSGGTGQTGGFDRSRTPGAGFANRVLLDENGELATEVITPDKETIITYDGDVHIVIDAFVKEHPEFSFRGSKGIIASTGYMGIFGYDLPDLHTEGIRQEVIAICDKFKENGWHFASHSYTHNRDGYWGPGSLPANISRDTRRWREEIEPIVGQTNLFIAPFGFLLRGESLQVILDNEFDIYCTVDFTQPVHVYDKYAVMGRIEIGGYSLSRYVSTLNRDFFDVESVKDSQRPPILSN